MKRGGIAVLMVMLTLLCACTAREAGSAAALMPAQVHEQTPEDTAPDTNAQESSETEAPEAATLPEEDAEPSERLIFDSVDELWTLLDARSMPDDELEAFLREHGYETEWTAARRWTALQIGWRGRSSRALARRSRSSCCSRCMRGNTRRCFRQSPARAVRSGSAICRRIRWRTGR